MESPFQQFAPLRFSSSCSNSAARLAPTILVGGGERVRGFETSMGVEQSKQRNGDEGPIGAAQFAALKTVYDQNKRKVGLLLLQPFIPTALPLSE